MSYKLSQEHLWVRLIKVCTNERTCFSSRGYISKIVKVYQNFKNNEMFVKTTRPLITSGHEAVWHGHIDIVFSSNHVPQT